MQSLSKRAGRASPILTSAGSNEEKLSVMKNGDDDVAVDAYPSAPSNNCGPTTSIGKVDTVLSSWKGKKEFYLAQAQVAVILLIAIIGDRWNPSYKRNENHDMNLFWASQVVLLIAAIYTWKHVKSSDGNGGANTKPVVFLSRGQTEEWKGWMQFAFIMYHYYRAWSAYNWIRVFVSSYVWMTGFGNFLYFDKKKDFTIKRMISMWIRINYFPILLSLATGASCMDDYYVVPLHTEGFFMTWVTCRFAVYLEERVKFRYWPSRVLAIGMMFVAHLLFYETEAVNFLSFFSDEIFFRFQADKYSALLGIACGALMKPLTEYMTWAYGNGDKNGVKWCQRTVGFLLIVAWYKNFGYLSEKTDYNPTHPYIFGIPMVGFLMMRNSSKYLSECHSTFLEYLGRHTLETYVLQFHLFMNHKVQYIPVVIPGATADGHIILKVLNMLLCGSIFVSVSAFARKVTVTTQVTITELVGLLQNANGSEHKSVATKDIEVPLLKSDEETGTENKQ